jgi:hypothetical protein
MNALSPSEADSGGGLPPRSGRLPDWPRLLSIELAAAYVGLGVTAFEALELPARRIGRRKLYDRNELDRWADRLDGQPVEDGGGADESKAAERRFLERRKARRNG